MVSKAGTAQASLSEAFFVAWEEDLKIESKLVKIFGNYNKSYKETINKLRWETSMRTYLR